MGSRRQAARFLGEARGDVSEALNNWFQSGAKPEGRSKSIDTKKAAAEFRRLRDEEDGVINMDGMIQMCEELGVDPFEDPTVLLIAFYMQAKSLDNVSEEDFLRGFQTMGVSTVKQLKSKLNALRGELDTNEGLFAQFFAYAYRVNCPEGMRVITGDVGIGLLRMLLVPRWDLGEQFVQFLEETKPATITRDTWNQLIPFSKAHPSSVEGFDEGAAWPVAVDDFVDWMRANAGRGGGGGATGSSS